MAPTEIPIRLKGEAAVEFREGSAGAGEGEGGCDCLGVRGVVGFDILVNQLE